MRLINDDQQRWRPFHMRALSSGSLKPISLDANCFEVVRERLFFVKDQKERLVLNQLIEEMKVMKPFSVFAISILNADKLPVLPINHSIRCLHISRLYSTQSEDWHVFITWLYRWQNLDTLLIAEFNCSHYDWRETMVLFRTQLKTIFLRSRCMPSEAFYKTSLGEKTRYLNCSGARFYSEQTEQHQSN